MNSLTCDYGSVAMQGSVLAVGRHTLKHLEVKAMTLRYLSMNSGRKRIGNECKGIRCTLFFCITDDFHRSLECGTVTSFACCG